MTAQQLIKNVSKLFSLPEVCTRLQEMLESPHHSSADFGTVISRDPDLTARLLKIVNSSFYGFPGRIDTINRAITVIGLSELLVLILGASSVMTFRNIPGSLINMANFWRHSTYCGVVGKELARRCHVLHSERLFVAGLLHDIGKLVLCQQLPAQMREVLARSYDSEVSEYLVERERLGFDHAELGGLLLEQWRLPSALVNAVSAHHDLDRLPSASIEAAIVHIANALTHVAEDPASREYYLGSISQQAWAITGLDPALCDEVLVAAMPMFDEALTIILPARR